MGSLLSSPKTPKATSQGASASPAASTPAITQAAQSSQKTREAAASEERAQNLLSRNRGRLGTIETGFRGFLSASNTSNGRKNLLGE